jgi:UDP-GlcNAc:undecaprenyl-phosphate GlcNAc-1-phosphate transferase
MADTGIKFTASEILDDLWWIGVVALGVSLFATPVVRFIAYRARIVDCPNHLLKPHHRPVAYLGGLAMCAGLLAGLGSFVAYMPNASRLWKEMLSDLGALRLGELRHNALSCTLSIGLACLVITVVGLLDDLVSLKPRQKIYGQIVAGAILLAGGLGQRIANIVLSPLHLEVPDWLLVPLSGGMAIVVIIFTSNATNLLDGLDGLCGGVTGIIAIGFLALAVWLAQWNYQPDIDQVRVGLCLAMAGAVIGFLPYNIPPASIFMGDAGSMLLGFFVATMMIMFCREGTARWFLAAWVVFALPVLDTALAVVRRLASGKSIFAGDRSHLYDQLVDRGMTVKQVVILFYILSAFAAVIAVTAAIYLRLRYAIWIYLSVLAAIWIVFYVKGMITPAPREPQPADSADSSGAIR